jgi:hypothetical protein
MREKHFCLLKNPLKKEKYTFLWTNFRATCTLIYGRKEYSVKTLTSWPDDGDKKATWQFDFPNCNTRQRLLVCQVLHSANWLTIFKKDAVGANTCCQTVAGQRGVVERVVAASSPSRAPYHHGGRRHGGALWWHHPYSPTHGSPPTPTPHVPRQTMRPTTHPRLKRA